MSRRFIQINLLLKIIFVCQYNKKIKNQQKLTGCSKVKPFIKYSFESSSFFDMKHGPAFSKSLHDFAVMTTILYTSLHSILLTTFLFLLQTKNYVEPLIWKWFFYYLF